MAREKCDATFKHLNLVMRIFHFQTNGSNNLDEDCMEICSPCNNNSKPLLPQV